MMTPTNITSASHCHKVQRSGTMPAGAEYTTDTAGNLPDSEVFSRPEFLDVSMFGRVYGFGWDALTRKASGMAVSMYSTSHHPLPRLNNGAMGFESHTGANTMTATTLASRCAAPTTQATTEEARAFAMLQASSNATMAKLYLDRGNIAAARRKTVQLLKALQVLEVASASTPCTKCCDNFPLPVAMDYFDQRVIADYTQRRTACTAVPDADKPCLRKGGAV